MSYIKHAFILFLFSFLANPLMAQQPKYDTLWSKVERLLSKEGLTASAAAEVKKIYALAKRDNNDAQLLKALIYQSVFLNANEEDAEVKAIALLEAERKTTKEPALSVLNSVLAERYLRYYQSHRWILFERSATNDVSDNLETWSVAQFHKRISELYLLSIQHEKLLQDTKIERFDPVTIKGNVRALRPTLFDLLAFSALDYFRNEERDVTRPAYAFSINDAVAFADAGSFANHHFVTADSLSLQHKAIQVYQRLLAFHSKDAKPEAFIDADIHRLQFVKQYAQLENKDSLYLKALENITRKFADYKVGAPAYFVIAQWHADKAGSYEPGKDTAYRYSYVIAKDIAEKILAVNKDNEAAANSRGLLNMINGQQLRLNTEKVNIPGKPFRTLVTFKNIGKLNLRLVQLSDAMKNQLADRYDDKYWQQLTSFNSQSSWSQVLPATNDYQSHAVEIKIDALPPGNYLLLASTDDKFALKGSTLAAQYFFVSNISYVNNNTDYFVLHRESGKPLAGSAVQVWTSQYDYNMRKNVLKAGEKLQADEHGFFRLKERPRSNANIRLEFTYNKDHYFEDENEYGIYREVMSPEAKTKTAEAFEKENAAVYFFTDRSIYRPGQKVYFKGIAITKDFDTRSNKLLTSFKSTLKLYNANYEQVDSIVVTTNEFGSYSGSFQLPESGLNGLFRIRDEELDRDVSFSVEEYKRPKFYIEYDELKGSYKLNDSIRVTGIAKAYAGNNINGAKVSYSIVREARFLYPWMFWRIGYPATNRMAIAHGELTTDEQGKFTVTFNAIPDRSVNPSLAPVFDYKIVANVTDLNGETRVGEKMVSVSYKALRVDIKLEETAIAIDSLKSLTVATTNLNGQHEPSTIKLRLYKLVTPDRLVKKRYWERPDLFLLNKESFENYFPNDEYDTETQPETWQRGEKSFETKDSSRINSPIKITTTNLTEGWYVIEAISTDKYGQEVKDVKYIQLYDPKNNKMTMPVYEWNSQRMTTIEPGQQSAIGIGSAADDLFVIEHIDKSIRQSQSDTSRNNANQFYKFLTLNKERKWMEFGAEERDRGGYGVFHFFVKHNRFYLLSNTVSVPWSNKELRISYETFRDKTLPGSEEKWKIKISGNKNEKVAAELLASMYDASLDQFKPHQWRTPAIWPEYGYPSKWSGNRTFKDVMSDDRYNGNDDAFGYYKQYDALLSQSQERLMGMRGRIRGVASQEMKMSKSVGVADEAVITRSAPRNIDGDGSKVLYDSLVVQKAFDETDPPGQAGIATRKNFNETAFFFPDLKTDAEGNIEFGFTIPEALTKWKLQTIAHTKDLAFALSTKEVITQKELMVQPNAPRYLREGDRLQLSTKIVNLSPNEITGTVQLELLDARTMNPIDGWFQNAMPNQFFTVAAGQSIPAVFSIEVPYQFNSAVVYRFTAKTTASVNGGAALSDGEEATLPVVSNSMLVTETMPLPMQGSESKKFSFDKLLQAGNSETLKHHALTVEFTTNPAWYAVQALPYLAEPAIESADHLFNRFYANALAFHIANSSPRIREMFERWKNADTASLLSNLQKNQELKSVLLEETPWVLQAKSESEQKKNIALLFDMVKMSNALSSSLSRIREMQSPNGGFMWFKGGPDDRYITQYILSSIGHLKKLNAIPAASQPVLNEITASGIRYLDERIREDYTRLTKSKKPALDKNNLGYLHIQYLYMRSFFNDIAIPGASFNAVNYYRKQTQQYWLQQSKYMQGMIALSLFRTGDKAKADAIMKSLLENSTYNEELGRYWKQNQRGYFWYQAPVETQSLLIEAFSDIRKDEKTVNELKTWLLKEKQTTNWKTNKATADACYALLLSSPNGSAGASWLANTPEVVINLGDKTVRSADEKTEAGTGYFKKSFDGPFVNPTMGNISLQVSSAGSGATALPSWGAVYWQYFERLDKITNNSGGMKVNKQLFVEKNTDRGVVLQKVDEGQALHTGDKVKIRVELTTDRDMEYVHLKDMRASSMEPLDVLSGYKWKSGVGYYETTKDASTNFFFSWLPRGTYVFEYPVFVTSSGNFSNGITSVQCLYAPEFAAHSEGVRVVVE